eukprot:jgi/Mesvir1/9685/Mv12166-RA.1
MSFWGIFGGKAEEKDSEDESQEEEEEEDGEEESGSEEESPTKKPDQKKGDKMPGEIKRGTRPQKPASTGVGYSAYDEQPDEEVHDAGASFLKKDKKLQPSIDELNSFLFEAQALLCTLHRQQPGQKCTIVIGNESADLDSIVSALSYALLLHIETLGKTDASSIAPRAIFVPVINIPRADFRMRFETVQLFKELGVDVPALLFIDEVDLHKLHKANRLQLILVDHNTLAASQSTLADAVVEIIDHHKKDVLPYPSLKSSNIQEVGSCATLVADEISRRSSHLLGDRGISKLLLSAILLDTVDLDKSTNRCTDLDEMMAALCINGAGRHGHKHLYIHLQEARFSDNDLSAREVLLLDYKQWVLSRFIVGCSSVRVSLAELVKRNSGGRDAMVTFRNEMTLDVLVVLSAYYTERKEFKREMAICGNNEDLVHSISESLAGDAALQLKKAIVPGLSPSVRVFAQGNTQFSRKQLQPLLDGLFKEQARRQGVVGAERVSVATT